MLDIAEVSAAAGLAPSTLRYYEKRGLLEASDRKAGRRQYDPEVLTQLALIEVGRNAGFTLDEIRVVLDAGVDRGVLHAMVQKKLEDLDAQITKAQLARTYLEHTLNCPNPEPPACPTLRQILGNILPRTQQPA